MLLLIHGGSDEVLKATNRCGAIDAQCPYLASITVKQHSAGNIYKEAPFISDATIITNLEQYRIRSTWHDKVLKS